MGKKATTELSVLQSLLKKEMAVLIYFYNDDCPPCLSLRPKVEEMVNSDLPRMKIIWVNSKSTPEIPANFGVFANPTILIYFEGREFKRYSKYVSVIELKQAASRYYNLMFTE